MKTLDSLHISAEGVKPYAIVDTSLDARRAIQFAVSIIYRASLSKSNHFSNIALGPYTKPAADISLGAGDADLNAVLVLINVLTSPDLNTKQFAFYPVRCAGDNGPYFIYVISGIQFVVKFGGKFKTLTSNDTYSDHLKIDPDKTVSVCCFPFNESAEADWLKNVARRN